MDDPSEPDEEMHLSSDLVSVEGTYGQNVWICAFSMVLLNYNCGITSYIVYLQNEKESFDSNTYVFATMSVLLGLLFGELIFGLFGDAIGRRRSFVGSSMLIIAGSFLSIFFEVIPGHSSTADIMVMFGLFRFILGVGAGGLYPLLAAVTRESSQEDIANTNVAYIFGPIGSIGLIIAPMLVAILSYTSVGVDAQCRLLLIIGAIPSVALPLLGLAETMAEANQLISGSCCSQWCSESFFAVDRKFVAAFSSASFAPYLLGTSLSWFFSDFLHYGNILCQVHIIEKLLASDSYDDDTYQFTIHSITVVGMVSSALFWVGGLISIQALKHLSALALQLHGFALSGAAYFLAALVKAYLPTSWVSVTVFLYASCYLFTGFGPGPMTFLAPSFLFPHNIRSTANGIAAAVGKVGAMVGILIVGYAGLGIADLMALYGGMAMLGVATTVFTIQTHFRANSSRYQRPHKGSIFSVFSQQIPQPQARGGSFSGSESHEYRYETDELYRLKYNLANYGAAGGSADVMSGRAYYDDTDIITDQSSLLSSR